LQFGYRARRDNPKALFLVDDTFLLNPFTDETRKFAAMMSRQFLPASKPKTV